MTVKINRSVKRYRNLHVGETVVILCNGPSLDWHALSQIDSPTIGLNASWMVHASTYHVATDAWQFKNYAASPNVSSELLAAAVEGKNACGWPTTGRDINSWRNLFTADVEYSVPTPRDCVRLQMLDHGGEARWSYDLTEGVYLCTTITWYALQLARYMGFWRAILLGFDLGGYEGRSKFLRHPKASAPFFGEITDAQNRLMGWARKELDGQMEILNGRPPLWLGPRPESRCTTLEEILVGW